MIETFNCANDVIVGFQWDGVVQYSLEIERFCFGVAEGAKLIFNHYFTVYNEDYRRVV